MANAFKTLEQIGGALLMLLVLLDVFLTVLYARIGTGILSRRLARTMWSLFRMLARRMHLNRGAILACRGPTILVSLVLLWGLGLMLGSALILHPHLGASIKTSSGRTDTDFLTALFVGGSSISIIGASSYEPKSDWFKMFFLFNSLVGISVLSLTLTYLMQIYSALLRRNSIGLSVDLASGGRGDAAQFIAGIGSEGHFETGYTILANLAESLADMKEAHHFYPVLFYFRCREPYYSVSRLTNVALDAMTIIRMALDSNKYRWLIESGSIAEIWEASLLLLITLEDAFVPGGVPKAEPPDRQTREQWRGRFLDAIDRLQAADIAVAANPESAANAYIALRSEWSAHIRHLAPSMLYSIEEVDPATAVAHPASEELKRAA
ncbi:MAG: conserved rane protein of unknown function [Acidobacteriaceae bacterium]|nr:conserved rane protein of unknown function [Acidobacteriaceae bacterium]